MAIGMGTLFVLVGVAAARPFWLILLGWFGPCFAHQLQQL